MKQRILLVLLVLIFLTLAYFVGNLGAPVQAKASDPAIPDCVTIGKSGPLVVSRCEDPENGQIIYVNNYGMMVAVP